MKCQSMYQVGLAGVDGLRGDLHDERCDEEAVVVVILPEIYEYDTESEGVYLYCTAHAGEHIFEARQIGVEWVETYELDQTKHYRYDY